MGSFHALAGKKDLEVTAAGRSAGVRRRESRQSFCRGRSSMPSSLPSGHTVTPEAGVNAMRIPVWKTRDAGLQLADGVKMATYERGHHVIPFRRKRA